MTLLMLTERKTPLPCNVEMVFMLISYVEKKPFPRINTGAYVLAVQAIRTERPAPPLHPFDSDWCILTMWNTVKIETFI
jgi:hypothetical protein